MTNAIFAWMLLSACGIALLTGRTEVLADQLLISAGQAVETTISMCGGFAFFCGVLAILRESGVMRALGRLLQKPLGKLFGELDDESRDCIAMNLSANMLGMGNAATPMGIRAVQKMARGDTATNAICLFLVINASSVQLLPATMLALRSAAGSQHPGAVVVPSLLASGASTLAGIVSCKLMERFT